VNLPSPLDIPRCPRGLRHKSLNAYDKARDFFRECYLRQKAARTFETMTLSLAVVFINLGVQVPLTFVHRAEMSEITIFVGRQTCLYKTGELWILYHFPLFFFHHVTLRIPPPVFGWRPKRARHNVQPDELLLD
jgi:hypothetical protein